MAEVVPPVSMAWGTFHAEALFDGCLWRPLWHLKAWPLLLASFTGLLRGHRENTLVRGGVSVNNSTLVQQGYTLRTSATKSNTLGRGQHFHEKSIAKNALPTPTCCF